MRTAEGGPHKEQERWHPKDSATKPVDRLMLIKCVESINFGKIFWQFTAVREKYDMITAGAQTPAFCIGSPGSRSYCLMEIIV